jgi:uncharacterized repeat protein (TIGR04076 family)
MKFNSEEIMDRRDFVQSGTALATGFALAGVSTQLSYAEETQESQERRKSMIHKCKITVLRRELYQDLADQYLADPKSGKCPYFIEGQEFLVDSADFFRMLNGKFCSEAWDCISRYVYAALQGGSIMRGWTNDERIMIACCNDGTRPVIFKLERFDE